MRAVVTRYAGRIQAYELWNEPNDTHFYQGSLATLVTMTQRAHNIIRSIDANATILTPSPTYTTTSPEQWMDQYLGAGGVGYFDVVAFHGYTNVMNRVSGLKTVMTKYAVSGKPIWDTPPPTCRWTAVPSMLQWP